MLSHLEIKAFEVRLKRHLEARTFKQIMLTGLELNSLLTGNNNIVRG